MKICFKVWGLGFIRGPLGLIEPQTLNLSIIRPYNPLGKGARSGWFHNIKGLVGEYGGQVGVVKGYWAFLGFIALGEEHSSPVNLGGGFRV